MIGASDQDAGLVSLYATGSVNGGSTTSTANHAGGLIGLTSGTRPLISSYATGFVKGANDAGGLVGYSDVPILDSHATGNVTVTPICNGGGLVGYNNATISDSFATGTVTGHRVAMTMLAVWWATMRVRSIIPSRPAM